MFSLRLPEPGEREGTIPPNLMQAINEARILAHSLYTKTRRRLPWIASGAGAFLFGVVAFGTVQDRPEPIITPQIVVEQLVPAPVAVDETVAGGDYWAEERFQRGDTIASLLDRLGVDDAEAARLLRSPEQSRALRWLRPGMTVQARVGSNGELNALWYIAGRDLLVTIDRDGDGFRAGEQPAELQRRVMMKSGEIRSSLFAATDSAGLPDSVATQLADMFGGDIDFHRDLRRGDRFTVVYEMHSHNGRDIKSGRVRAAEFVNQKKVLRAVWWANASNDGGGKGGYFTPEGKNLRKAFLRSPLEFSRVSSGFAMRFHPILRQWRAHKGVDYAAPTGTRVKATGDGIIEFVGRQAGYGNLVVVRHHGSLTTHYAHLSSVAPGVRKGARTSQGDVIGYVGQTGWATGPHLHYEFRVGNEHRNPLTVALPAALPVPSDRLAAFRSVAGPLSAQLDMLRDTNLALLE